MLCLQVKPGIPRELCWFRGTACLQMIRKMEPQRVEYNFTGSAVIENSVLFLTDTFLVQEQ